MKLEAGEVHIWSTTFNEDYSELLSHSYLSESEHKRVLQFSNDIDSLLFSMRHKLLRIILSRYLNCQPFEIEFKGNSFQKPYIYSPTTGLQFNVSSSSNRFIAVICRQNSVGTDIEFMREVRNIHQLISDYLTSNESDWIYAQPQQSLESSFFSIWTKKEALIKAIGQGLSIPINQLEVLSVNPVAFCSDKWYITPLSLFDDCNAALAINSPIVKFTFFDALELF
jgi:4'-phosphopantetheinyl transferase